jgi:uncharacterized protein (DUF58 family)
MPGFIKTYIAPLYLSRRFYALLGAIIFLFVLSYAMAPLLTVAKLALLFFAVLTLLDYIALFSGKNKITVTRELADRFSNGDWNKVQLHLLGRYSFNTGVHIIDELPAQFQVRDFLLKTQLKSGVPEIISYRVRPVQRGEYVFNDINVFISSPLRLVMKRNRITAAKTVKVLPSFLSLKKYELRAHASNLAEAGNKRMRKLGQSLEFEQIKEYVPGDDRRAINWKATARKGQLMVNNYTDEKSQQVYCLIDKGRVMKMPFEGMRLLDYAINAALVVLRVALIKQDKAGLVSFADQAGSFLPAGRKAAQMSHILEALYNQQTHFFESDFERLYMLVKTRITQRSLILLFTNFESLAGLQRQLPYIRGIARNHLLLVVFFENTEIRELTGSRAETTEELYTKTIAEKFAHEKKLIVKELQQHGILSILTTPEQLTIDAVNKYLEIKARQGI